MPHHLNHGNSAKVYEKREWNRNFMTLTIFIYFETNTFIWLESSEVDNVRTSGLKCFLYRKFQILVQDPNEGLSINSSRTGFIFAGFIYDSLGRIQGRWIRCW